MIASLRAWFADRSLRERRMIVAMAALAALTLVWALIIRPVGDGLSAARERHAAAVESYADTEARVAAIKALRAGGAAPDAGELDAVVRQRANAAGFPLASLTPQAGGAIQISIASARPGALFAWIADLDGAGIVVDSLGTTDNGDRTVSAQMTLRSRGP